MGLTLAEGGPCPLCRTCSPAQPNLIGGISVRLLCQYACHLSTIDSLASGEQQKMMHTDLCSPVCCMPFGLLENEAPLVTIFFFTKSCAVKKKEVCKTFENAIQSLHLLTVSLEGPSKIFLCIVRIF